MNCRNHSPRTIGAYKATQTCFKRQVLNLQFALYDKNRLRLSVHEYLDRSDREKKNANGKTKTKCKYKKTITFHLKLIVDATRFTCKPLPEEQSQGRLYQRVKGDNLILGIVWKEQLKGQRILRQEEPTPVNTIRNLILLYSYVQAIPQQG